MSITDELREYAEDWDWLDTGAERAQERIEAIADHIDAAHRAALEKLAASVDDDRDGWIELPKDADGEYINVGDMLDGYGKTIEVVELCYGRSGWVIISRDGNAYADNYAFTHHRTDTWERIISDALSIDGDLAAKEVAATFLVARCRALASEPTP